MTQEEKELLLKDLGTRLAYHPVIYGKEGISTNEGSLTSVTTSGVFINTKGGSTRHYFIEEIKPYLRPMSSMTEEEDMHRCAFLDDIEGGVSEAIPNYIDWLNKYHFDYRGLIKKGLALEAQEGMYEF